MYQGKGEIAGNGAKRVKDGVSFSIRGSVLPFVVLENFPKNLADRVSDENGGLFSDFDFGKIFRKVFGTSQYVTMYNLRSLYVVTYRLGYTFLIRLYR